MVGNYLRSHYDEGTDFDEKAILETGLEIYGACYEI